MPTVLPIDGLCLAVYLNDHPSAHVHAMGPRWVVFVNLHGLKLREVIGPCAERDARRVLDLAAEHGAALLEAWGRFHG